MLTILTKFNYIVSSITLILYCTKQFNDLINMAKPFLKWAGGKTQLIDSIQKSIPTNFQNEQFTYIEPFVGSGAVFFWMLENYPNMKNAVLNDINEDLINCYKSIKNNINELIAILKKWESEYHAFQEDIDSRKEYYYLKRTQFNTRESSLVTQGALFIFLNRTCFNGLYRVNKSNGYNVPIGSYKKPQICNEENLLSVSKALQNVTLLSGDYEETLQHATSESSRTIFYLDPPYKPLSETSSFNSYSKGEFNDSEQVRLKDFCHTINNNGFKWILSNSDMKNTNPENNFFDDLYEKFKIQRVYARRNINSNPNNRGKITELLITN